MTITVVGQGYVGLSLSCLLAPIANVNAIDIDEGRISLINKGISPIKDSEIESFLAKNSQALHASCNASKAYAESDLIIIATPTNYDEVTGSFDTSTIESVLNEISAVNHEATVVIKSTVPVGYTAQISNRSINNSLIFSPEFLREGHALHDNFYPSRIVAGITKDEDLPKAELFCKLLQEGAKSKDVPKLITGSTEAEAIKLFANTYLALRISFFNELDTYAETKNLRTSQIIQGVCLDPRIGDFYNNPSFGYGGYCLPKDSKQLLANYSDVPQNLIKAVVDSNHTRKSFIAEQILKRKPSTVGAYKLAMKAGSDNFRQSAIIDIIQQLLSEKITVIIYEPLIEDDFFMGCKVYQSLEEFKKDSDIIIANRMNSDLSDVGNKLYTRDLWNRD